jgi:hypothetical protein
MTAVRHIRPKYYNRLFYCDFYSSVPVEEPIGNVLAKDYDILPHHRSAIWITTLDMKMHELPWISGKYIIKITNTAK